MSVTIAALALLNALMVLVAIVNDSAATLLNEPAVGSTLRVAPRSGDFASSIEVRIVGIIESPVEPRV